MMNSTTKMRFAATLCTIAGLAVSAAAQIIHDEVEPNDTKAHALANGVILLNVFDGVRGITTGSSTTAGGAENSADTFLIKTAPAAPGIYRHRISVDQVGNSVNLRGITQSNGVPNFASDAQLQTGTTVSGVARTVQWYGFGKEEQFYLRVNGTTSTTGQYTATLMSTEQVFPIEIGTVQGGEIEITTKGHATADTKLWVFDDNLNPIPEFGNTNMPAPDVGVRSRLVRTFNPGTYYLAVAINNLAVSEPAASDDSLRNSNMVDFPNMVVGASGNSNANVSFAIRDQFGPQVFPALVPTGQAFTVHWYKFTVGTVTENLGACCMPDGTCANFRSDSCTVVQGTFGGVGVACSAVTCDQPGACCVPFQGCLVLSSIQCGNISGANYGGNGSTCAATPCNTPGVTIEQFPGDIVETFAAAPTGNQPSYLGMDGRCLFTTDPFGNGFHVTGGWGFACSISGSSVGASRIAASTSGGLVMDFTVPVKKFGVFLGSNSPSGNLGWLDVYDQNGLIGTATIPQHDNDCGMRWAGWQFSQPVTKLVIRTNYSNGSYMQIALPRVEWDEGSTCYANCDGSTTAPILNVEDFTCFINEFAAASQLPHEQQLTHYANCDQSTTAPVLNVEDFTCFINKFAQGCD
jgi:hypothetical protein